VNYDPLEYPEKWQKFVDFTHGQINELTSEYGKVDILWLDGGWVAKMSDGEIREWYKGMLQSNPNGFIKKRVVSQDIKIDELAKIARKNQPGILVVDRAVYGKHQNYLTPENRVPDQLLPYPWESCIIAGGGWSWVNDPKFKSPREVIHLLVDIVSKGGNLLLNIAPSPEGTWHGDAYKLLNDIGKWMAVNDEAIYSTKPIEPYKEGQVRVTKKDGAVYAIYLGAEDENGPPSKIWLSSIQPKNDAKLTLLGTEQSLQWEKAENGVVIEIPDTIRQEPPCDFAWVVKISTIID
jgi:alpha-L-fucosidase